MQEFGDDQCLWSTYFKALPLNYDNFGANFSDEELNMAQGTNLAKIKEDIRLSNHNHYYLLVGMAKSYNTNLPFNQLGT